jgi:hypothetical protein
MAGRWGAIWGPARPGSCDHFIEYLRLVFAGDEIVIFTWAASLALREVSRRYLFQHADDHRVLAALA